MCAVRGRSSPVFYFVFVSTYSLIASCSYSGDHSFYFLLFFYFLSLLFFFFLIKEPVQFLKHEDPLSVMCLAAQVNFPHLMDFGKSGIRSKSGTVSAN